MKVFTVHGIRRQHRWGEDFKALSTLSENRLEAVDFDYDYFNTWKFLLPSKRKQIVDKFVLEYEKHKGTPSSLPSVIAHSFGTDVVFHAMLIHPEIKFNVIIFSGTVLSRKTDFRPLLKRGQFKTIYNDHGNRDLIVYGAKIANRKRYGLAGKYGFEDVPATHKKSIINTEEYKGHSDYFTEMRMTQLWIPRIARSRDEFKYKDKVLTRTIFDRLKNQNFQSNTLHKILSIAFYARIDLDGNYFAKYVCTGVNNTSDQVTKYVFVTSADSMAAIASNQFHAFDFEGNELEYKVIENERQYRKIEVDFHEPIKQGHHCNYKMYFCWLKTMLLDTGDTDHWNTKDIPTVTIQLNFPRPLKGVKLFETNSNEVTGVCDLNKKTEIDKTTTYFLTYDNLTKNTEGLVFYFEGIFSKQERHPDYKGFSPVTYRSFTLPSEVGIRVAQERDIQPIYNLESTIDQGNAANEETLRQRWTMFKDGFLVAEEKGTGEIVGYIESLIWNEKEFETFDDIHNFPTHYNIRGRTLYVIFLAVHPKYRNHGIGKKLIEAIVTVALNYSLDRISLVSKGTLKDYYAKLGFSEIKELPNYLGITTPEMEPSILMELILNAKENQEVKSETSKQDPISPTPSPKSSLRGRGFGFSRRRNVMPVESHKHINTGPP